MAHNYDLAQTKHSDETCKIFSVGDRGVAWPWRVDVWVVVSPAVRECTVSFTEEADLVRPIVIIAERTVDEHDGGTCPHFHVVQPDAIRKFGYLHARLGGFRGTR